MFFIKKVAPGVMVYRHWLSLGSSLRQMNIVISHTYIKNLFIKESLGVLGETIGIYDAYKNVYITKNNFFKAVSY